MSVCLSGAMCLCVQMVPHVCVFMWYHVFMCSDGATCFMCSGGAMCLCVQVVPTTEKIDVEKLKVREKIHFYADILLFEDELSDNGCSMLRVKIVSKCRRERWTD